MGNKIEEVEKLLRTHLELMMNGAFETNTDPAIIADRIVKLFAIPVVSGCACPMESTDVYDDNSNYLGYVCLGCGYFSKYNR